MSFDVNILVNGSRCKQYQFQGKIFVQANPGSEYVLEIKNNYWKRILAVSSVDSLNTLTGKTASEEDSGYIIGSYSSEKIKGFRISDTEWALFKFGYKFNGNTYAQSKEDGSEKNCGVIGFRFFYEEEPIITYTTTTTTTWPQTYAISASYACNALPPFPFSGGMINSQRFNLQNMANDYYIPVGADVSSYTSNVNYTSNNIGNQQLRDVNATALGVAVASAASPQVYNCSIQRPIKKELFDIGTEFGRKETSKVKNVDFHRGCLAQAFDIYYASRESLISMGVPIHNTLSTNLPQSFPNQYCNPPKGWNG